MLFIALLALVTGLVALLLYYYGLQRTPASVAAIAELTFPVVAIAVGYLAFDATLTASQLAGVVLTSLVVMLLPVRAPTLVEPQTCAERRLGARDPSELLHRGLELLVRVVRRRAEAEVAPAAVRDDALVEEPAAQLLGALRLEGEEPAEGARAASRGRRVTSSSASSSKRSASSVVCCR